MFSQYIPALGIKQKNQESIWFDFTLLFCPYMYISKMNVTCITRLPYLHFTKFCPKHYLPTQMLEWSPKHYLPTQMLEWSPKHYLPTQMLEWSASYLSQGTTKTTKLSVPRAKIQITWESTWEFANFVWSISALRTQTFFRQTAKTDQTGWRPGWSESSLDAQVIVLALSYSCSETSQEEIKLFSLCKYGNFS